MAPNGPNDQKPLIKYLICLLLAAITIAAFAGVDHCSFIVFDDGNYVVNHAAIQHGFSWKSLKWAFSSFDSSNWHPLTWLSLMADYQFFGLNPAGYHLINLTFHVANTVLLFLLLEHLTRRTWAPAFVALLFGIHPMHVESVAWISERKDVLCSFFFLLTLMAYVRYVETQSAAPSGPRASASGPGVGDTQRIAVRPWMLYALTLFLFVLGLMSKPMVVTLPFVLLLLDLWPLQRFDTLAVPASARTARMPVPLILRRTVLPLIIEKIPFFVLSALSCYLTYLAQRNGGAIREATEYPVLLHLNHACISYAWYILKLFWPVHLSIYYQLWTGRFGLDVLCSLVALVVITALAVRHFRKYPYFLFGWLWFLGMLVPVIGLVQVGSQAYADRYTYLPYIGLFIIIAWGIPDLLKSFSLAAPPSCSSRGDEAQTNPTANVVQPVQTSSEHNPHPAPPSRSSRGDEAQTNPTANAAQPVQPSSEHNPHPA
ncbi:MAG: hypothetical protein ACREE6_01605, partial [Limisphaerales bacterium]